jgi:transglutaminase-like putative cysteine protease
MDRHADALACLEPTTFIDSGAENVVEFARAASAAAPDDLGKAVLLYYAVRDGIVYTPYCDFRSPDTFRASAVLAKGSGFCVGKAALLSASARAVGIPARIGFADVRNHLCTPRLRALMGTDVFYYHGYTELYLGDRWIKATPAFDRSLCERFGVRPLEFDGRADSLFHPFDVAGRRHMEYVRDRGASVDVPAADIMATFERAYPNLASGAGPAGAFRREAEEARSPRSRPGERDEEGAEVPRSE